MSSRYEFSSFYEFIGLPIIEGTILELDPSNDTAKVGILKSDGGSIEEFSNVPIFFHCRKDSPHRSNGAIEGAASAFSIGDKVLVLCRVNNVSKPSVSSCVAVIGHVEARKECEISFTVLGGQATGDLSYGLGGPFIAPYRYAFVEDNPIGKKLVLLYNPRKTYEDGIKYREEYSNMPSHFYFFPQLARWYHNVYEHFDKVSGQGTGQFFHPSPYQASIKIPIGCSSFAIGTIPFYISYEPNYWDIKTTIIDGISYKTVAMPRFSLVERIQLSAHAPQIGGSYLTASTSTSDGSSTHSASLVFTTVPKVLSVYNEVISVIQPYGVLTMQLLCGLHDPRFIMACGYLYSQSETITDTWTWDSNERKYKKQYSVANYNRTAQPLDSTHMDPTTPHQLQKGVLHVCPSDKGLNLIRAETFYADMYSVMNYQVVEDALLDVSLGPSTRILRYGRYKLTTISPSGDMQTITLDDPRYYGSGFQAWFTPRCFGYHPNDSDNLIVSSSYSESSRTGTATFTDKSLFRYVGDMWFSHVHLMPFSDLTQKVCSYYASRGIIPCPISWVESGDNLTITNTFRTFLDRTGVEHLLWNQIPPVQKDYFSAVDQSTLSWTESSFENSYTKYKSKIYLNNKLVLDGELLDIVFETRNNSWTEQVGDPPLIRKYTIICGGEGFSGYGYGDMPPMSNKYDMIAILPYRFFITRSQTFSYGGWVFFAKKIYQSHTLVPVQRLIVPGGSYFYRVDGLSNRVFPAFRYVPFVFCKVRTKMTFHVACLINDKFCVYDIPDTVCSLEFDEFFACADVSGTKYSSSYYPSEGIRSVARPINQPYHYVDLISCTGFPCMFTACLIEDKALVFKYDVFKYDPWTHTVVYFDLPPIDNRRVQQYRLQGNPPLATDAMPTDSRYLGIISFDDNRESLTVKFHEKVFGDGAYTVYDPGLSSPISDVYNVLRAPRVNNILDL